MSSGQRFEQRHRRYIISGAVRFVMNFEAGSGTLVNIGEGGLLLRSDVVLPEGSAGALHVAPSGYPLEIEVKGEVVGVKGDLIAIRFLYKPETVSGLMQWLEQEHYPWAGGIATDALRDARPAARPPRDPADDTELESARELAFQEA